MANPGLSLALFPSPDFSVMSAFPAWDAEMPLAAPSPRSSQQPSTPRDQAVTPEEPTSLDFPQTCLFLRPLGQKLCEGRGYG